MAKEWIVPDADLGCDGAYFDYQELVRCRDCRWWDKIGDSPIGYCFACRHGHYSNHWEISIYRTYKGDFFCADGERSGGDGDV